MVYTRISSMTYHIITYDLRFTNKLNIFKIDKVIKIENLQLESNKRDERTSLNF